MKNFFLLLSIVSLVLISCDGRKSKSESLKASVEAFTQKQSTIELINFYPKKYTEVITDTLISNQVNVKIRNFSLPNKTIAISSSDTKNRQQQSLHRVFESEITISTASKTIFERRVSAEEFKTANNYEFWNNATLQHAWVNQELSTADTVQVDITFINPKENTYKLYRMSIGADGQQLISLIEENS
ncbi:MAG TPA: hypothetical protein VKZ98_12495 [Aquaticitalea sp.]|nr:hypothetical protein [Aquaticitalea sp.]